MSKELTTSQRAERYVKWVLKGADVPVPIKGCVRKWVAYKEEYGFDKDQVNERGELMKLLHLPEGKKGFLELMDWQCFVLSWMYAFWRRDGLRALSKLMLLVPRKAGKTTFAAGVGLGEVVMPSNVETGPRILFAGQTDEVCDMGYGKIQSMLNQDIELGGEFVNEFGVELHNKQVYCRSTDGWIRRLTMEGRTREGFTPSFIYVDEISRMPTSADLRTLRSGFGHNADYMMFMTTTYSDLPTSALAEERERVKVWLEDDTDLGRDAGILYEAQLEDDWLDRKVWRRTQPAWDEQMPGIEVVYEELAKEAMLSPSGKYSFEARQLCKPMHGGIAWIGEEHLRALEPTSGPIPQGRDWVHYIGCDFSDTLSTTALCLLSVNQLTGFREARFKIFYCTGEGEVQEAGQKDKKLIQHPIHRMYQEYEQQGHVSCVDGPTISHGVVAEHIQLWDDEVKDVRMILSDHYDAYEEVREKLRPKTRNKFKQVGKSAKNTTAAAHLLKNWVKELRLRMDPNPVVHQHFKNTHAKLSTSGGLKLEMGAPDSPHRIDAVDSIVHAVLAYDISRADKYYATEFNPIDNRPAPVAEKQQDGEEKREEPHTNPWQLDE